VRACVRASEREREREREKQLSLQSWLAGDCLLLKDFGLYGIFMNVRVVIGIATVILFK
jgi:hypothetical protein